MAANTKSSPTARVKLRIEKGPKRTRTFLDGIVVGDTIAPLLVWEHRYFPQYYFPKEDVQVELLVANGKSKTLPNLGEAEYCDVVVGSRVVANAAWAFPGSDIEQIRDCIRFDWNANALVPAKDGCTNGSVAEHRVPDNRRPYRLP